MPTAEVGLSAEVVFLIILSLHTCQGTIHLYVSPYPARVYENAPPGVPVLTVNAYDISTGQTITTFRLEKRGLSEYFSIDESGLMTTAKTIDRNIGFRFQFFVFGVSTAESLVEYRHAIVEVSEKNLYPPTFSENIYSFIVYRFSPPGTVIGQVLASDLDDEPHNRHFTIFAPLRQPDSEYVNVTSFGSLILLKELDDEIKSLQLVIQAVDSGSPQLTGNTTAIITIDDTKQPEVFCVSSTNTDTRICWKNPMPGQDHPGYSVSIQGQNVVFHEHIAADGDKEEFCVINRYMIPGDNYTVRISLDTNDTIVIKSVDLTFQKTGPGFSIQCLKDHFAACNFLQPCENGATCLMEDGGGMNYTCHCPVGWQGKNCTQMDLCPFIPCQNGGTCTFNGHQQYTCACRPDYFGVICQNYNVCAAADPCQNGGVCRIQENETYSCACPDYFTGDNCSTPDPCFPSPCGSGGTCNKLSDSSSNCTCYQGFHGDKCQDIDLCQSIQPCQNSGTCITTGNNTFKCQCPPDHTGLFCDLFNACLLACENNATCFMQADGNYNCSCPPAYHGNECQHFNSCFSNPCVNGVCHMAENTHVCDCKPGFFGPTCENYNACLSDPCETRGRCIQIPEDEREEDDLPYDCQCYDSWWGLNCEFANSCRIDVCQNGASCQNTQIPPNTFSCRCPAGYYGNDCSMYNPCEEIAGLAARCQNGGTCHNVSSNSYLCDCLPGYQGNLCQHLDPCVSSPCLNSGSCTSQTNGQLKCTCMPGYSGEYCQEELTCLEQPCTNGGTCMSGSSKDASEGGTHCACSEGYLGFFCQIPDPCYDGHEDHRPTCGSGTCESINRTLGLDLKEELEDPDFLYNCLCDQGHTGKHCEVPLLDCADVTCLNNGDCQHGQCICPPTFTGAYCETPMSLCDSISCADGLHCQVTGLTASCVCRNGWDLPDCLAACRAETTTGKTGRFSWSRTRAGQTATAACPYGGRVSSSGSAQRQCLYRNQSQDTVSWGPIDDRNCSELGLMEATRRLNALNEMTSHPATLDEAEVNNCTAILEELHAYTLMDQEVASVMMNVISNLGDVNMSVTVSSNLNNRTSERLIKLLDDYSEQVNITGDNVTITSRTFEIVAILIDNASSNFTYVPSVTTGNVTEVLDVSIAIPAEAFNLESGDGNFLSNQTRLQMTGHSKSQLFIPNNSSYDDTFIQHQPVLSAVVTGKQIVNLSTPVIYRIRNLNPDANYTCVFWDRENRTWSTDGVVTTVKSGNSTECQSNHLTSFAVLLDPSPGFALNAVDEAVLSYISYIGSAISLFCLLLTIITYSLFRSLNKDKSGKILLNLCVALFLLNAIFLISGLASNEDNKNGLDDSIPACTAVAVLLHYLLLSSLAWMLVEAAEMYRALVTVFAKYAQCYMLKRCLIGWGLPIVIVAITVGVDRANYATDGAFCFLSRSNAGAYYGSLVAPACVVLVINTIIFIMVTRVILKPRFQQQKQKESDGITPAQVRGAFTVMFLLGVTWVFGPLAIKEAKVVFNYIFCILNSLQGFLIFVFRCLFNPEVRMCWVQLIKTGTLKKRRGPILSNLYSDTSSKADAKSGSYPNGHNGGGFAGNNGSTTVKSSLIHSNGWHPKLNGHSFEGQMQRRGTKFSTLDLGEGSPESCKRSHQNSISDDQRYGNGNLDNDINGQVHPTLDYYETGHEGHFQNKDSMIDDTFHEENGVMDYYESIRTHPKREDDGSPEINHMNESKHMTTGSHVDETGQKLESGQRRGSSHSNKRISGVKSEEDELTYL